MTNVVIYINTKGVKMPEGIVIEKSDSSFFKKGKTITLPREVIGTEESVKIKITDIEKQITRNAADYQTKIIIHAERKD